MQSDPIGLEGGENGFVYVGGNPLARVDESGLASYKEMLLKAAKALFETRINRILSSPKFIRTTATKLKIYEKDGGFEQIIKDFYELQPALITVDKESIKVGILEDGKIIKARVKSSDGRPTLEISKKKENGKGEKKLIEIRYNFKLPFDDKPLESGLGHIDTMIGAAINGLFE